MFLNYMSNIKNSSVKYTIFYKLMIKTKIRVIKTATLELNSLLPLFIVMSQADVALLLAVNFVS